MRVIKFGRVATLFSATLCYVHSGYAAEFDSSDLVTTPQTQSTLSTSEQAQHWGLTLDEWQRYQTLMQGIRGSLSNDDISPLEVLGIHAENDAERRRYAERWAQLMFEDTARVLAFQREYHAAFKRLYPDVPAIDMNLLRSGDSAAQNVPLTSGDRLLFFTATSCTSCQAALQRLLERLREQTYIGLDIYVVDTQADSTGDETVRAWAQEQAIPAEWVRDRRITLNHDNGLLARFNAKAEPPFVIHQSQNGQSILPLSELAQ